MKTSFAKTLSDIQNEDKTQDEIYTHRIPKRNIFDSTGKSLEASNVYVIHPYDEQFKSTGVSTLLVNSELKKKYDLHANMIEKEKESVLSGLKRISKWNSRKVPVVDEISVAFSLEAGGLYRFLKDFLGQDWGYSDLGFTGVDYKSIFNDKVFGFINEVSVREDIESYIENYHKLIESSDVLDRRFSYQVASDTSNVLSLNGFFSAGHSVKINGSAVNTCVTKEELDQVIEREKDRILEDESLQSIFSSLDQKLATHKDLKGFRETLLDHQWLIGELNDWQLLKKKFWVHYLYAVSDQLESFGKVFDSLYGEIETISQQAEKEKTIWQNVVSIFNKRFYVPFRLKVGNQKNVILNNEEPVIEFYFDDSSSDEVEVDRITLLNVLSLGERRALYILNVLFDIHARRVDDVETLFVVDDIADSFDYKNKYAIIEYFKELSETKGFQFIFLTHNFDFHRTISGRLNIPGENRLSCIKRSDGLELESDRYQKSPFEYWKENLEKDDSILISAVPFIRNLCEYVGDSNGYYSRLTSLLHIKEDTKTITVEDLEVIIKSVVRDRQDLVLKDKDSLVVDLIYKQARNIFENKEDENSLEKKIVLSIAIRLLAEEYMIKEIDDARFSDNIKYNQTAELYKRYCERFPKKEDSISLLTQVNLMTPENIHLNSFMYEPILDMSILHLYDLYEGVSQI